MGVTGEGTLQKHGVKAIRQCKTGIHTEDTVYIYALLPHVGIFLNGELACV